MEPHLNLYGNTSTEVEQHLPALTRELVKIESSGPNGAARPADATVAAS